MTNKKVFFLIILSLVSVVIHSSVWSDHKVEKISFRFLNKTQGDVSNLHLLLKIKENENYNLTKIRKSIENLNKIGQFSKY